MKYLPVLAVALALLAWDQGAAQAPVPTQAPETTAIDPERLELARRAVNSAWPLGTYARMMNGQVQDMMDGMMASMMDLKAAELAQLDETGRAGEQETGDKTMRQLMTEADPHFEERFRIMNKVMMDEMAPIMDRIEPAFRDGLSHAFARKFTIDQLQDLNRFFATPTGTLYASESMLMYMEPEAMAAMMQFMPELIKEMPAIVSKVQAATAHLPPPPKPNPEE